VSQGCDLRGLGLAVLPMRPGRSCVECTGERAIRAKRKPIEWCVSTKGADSRTYASQNMGQRMQRPSELLGLRLLVGRSGSLGPANS
jgi:hypothetical protein